MIIYVIHIFWQTTYVYISMPKPAVAHSEILLLNSELIICRIQSSQLKDKHIIQTIPQRFTPGFVTVRVGKADQVVQKWMDMQ